MTDTGGKRELEAAIQRLATAKEREAAAGKSLQSTKETEESAKQMVEVAKANAHTAKRSREVAEAQWEDTKKEMEEAKKFLEETEKRCEVIDVDEEEPETSGEVKEIVVSGCGRAYAPVNGRYKRRGKQRGAPVFRNDGGFNGGFYIARDGRGVWHIYENVQGSRYEHIGSENPLPLPPKTGWHGGKPAFIPPLLRFNWNTSDFPRRRRDTKLKQSRTCCSFFIIS